jgi:hypothetical protein
MEALAEDPPALQGGGELQVWLADPRHARLLLNFGGARVELAAAFLSVPYPSGLHRLLTREPDVDAVVVDRIPTGLIEAATDAGVAVLDRHGHGRVVRPGFVYVAPPPRHTPAFSRSSTSPFAPKASRLVRALLVEPSMRWRLSSLAEAVDVDPGNAHRVLASLMTAGLLERDEDEYVTSDPGSLLEAWAEANRRPREQVSIPVPGALEDEIRVILPTLGPAAVVSGELAAERMAPYLPAQSALIHCYDRVAWERLARGITPRYIPEGSVLAGRLVVDLVDEGVAQFGETTNGLPLVHPVQAYVDLFGSRGRGREAGEHLRRELIGF